MRIVLASGNRGKLREFAALLAPLGFDVVPQSELGIETPPETGTTFVDNALLKARYASRAAQLPAIADDSGIEVDALDGRPGIYSARYAGEHADDEANLRKLLEELKDTSDNARTARYRCSIVFVGNADDPSPVIADGVWEGRILTEPRGTGGFGYDPIFLPLNTLQSVAEMPAADKNQVSHRAKALRALVEQLARRNDP